MFHVTIKPSNPFQIDDACLHLSDGEAHFWVDEIITQNVDLLEKRAFSCPAQENRTIFCFISPKNNLQKAVQWNGLLTARQTIAMKNVPRFYLTRKSCKFQAPFSAKEKKNLRKPSHFELCYALARRCVMEIYIKKRHIQDDFPFVSLVEQQKITQPYLKGKTFFSRHFT